MELRWPREWDNHHIFILNSEWLKWLHVEWPHCWNQIRFWTIWHLFNCEKKSFQHLFIQQGINTNSASIFVLEKKGLIMWYCEMAHYTVTRLKCSDFVIYRFGLSVNLQRIFCLFTHPSNSKCASSLKKSSTSSGNCKRKNYS